MTQVEESLHSSMLGNFQSCNDMDKLKFIAPRSPPIAILGVPFDNVTTAETLQMIEQMIVSRRPHHLATANVDFIVQAAQDVELRRILFDAHLVLCDGTPLVWASRLLGNRLPERVAGSDLVPLLLKVAAEKNYRPFLLGASTDSLEAAVQRATEQYPKLQFAGYYSPPFNKLLEMDHEEIRNRILQTQPDILFVAFGCPKQEKWINMHYRSLGVPVSVGVGGTIDFLAGKLARAPIWMQKTGTEWIFRLAQEPRRLFHRYATDFTFFSRGIASQWWRFRARNSRRRVVSNGPTEIRRLPHVVLEMPTRLDCEEVHLRPEIWDRAISPERACILDLKNVRFVDSTGVGLLIRLQKRSRAAGQQLILANPSDMVTRALDLMRLGEFFVLAPDVAAAEASLNEGGQCSSVSLRTTASANLPALAWVGELTAANSEEIWMKTMDHLAARALVQRALTVDLSKLRFIDSTGLSVMIRAKKYAARQGVTLRFSEPRENVLNVIQLSRLDDYLLKNE
jgi:N-acetylglucosaminyldiphosphoundecaprenol N-acetyl-beta-D-mannosaminyltransferase